MDKSHHVFHKSLKKAHEMLENKEFLIVSHKDADGLMSASLVSHFYGADYMLIDNLYDIELNKIPAGYEGYLFLDLGNHSEKKLFEKFKESVVVVFDHHPTNFNPSENSFLLKHNKLVVNSFFYGIDGNSSISATGMAFLMTLLSSPYGKEYYYLAFAGGFADMQVKKELYGYNKYFLDNAVVRNQIQTFQGLNLIGRNTRPLYKSIEYFLNENGIAYSSYDALALLKSLNIPTSTLKFGVSRPVKLADLSDRHQKILANALLMILQQYNKETQSLFRDVYLIKNLYDLEEFVYLINSAAKLSKFKKGYDLAINLKADLRLYDQYRKAIGSAINAVKLNPNKYQSINYYVFYDKELKDPSLTGTVATILHNTTREPWFIGYAYGTHIKFSLRAKGAFHLGAIAQSFCSSNSDCVANGHENAAGGVINSTQLKEFLEHINNKIKNKSCGG